jgi:dihydroorotate dehydrogenase (NAD+) catalytic subunit
MAFEITRPGKSSLIVESPVMPMAGILGFGDVYRDLIQYEKLGAFVTAPVSYTPRSPANGQRVVPLDAGLLLHTGLPNPGISKVMGRYRSLWNSLPMPVILHIVATSLEHVRKCASRADAENAVDALEIGLNDDIEPDTAEQMIAAAVRNTEKPVLARIPSQNALELARAVADAGAGAVVACAPPRGVARSPLSGRLVDGRVYGPTIKPVALRLVNQLSRAIDIPIIGAGGIHSQQDARDFMDAGARAVQVDTAVWVQPKLIEYIARDLGGLVVTRTVGALPDEWHPGMGETERKAHEQQQSDADDDSAQNTPR